MSLQKYHIPKGGLPPQSQLLTDKAVFTPSYAVIPQGTMRDIVCSHLPFWHGMRMWVLARPMSGFAESFSHYIVELEAEGGSDRPETDASAEGALFVVGGAIVLTVAGKEQRLEEGGFGFIPAGYGLDDQQCGQGSCRLSLVPQSLCRGGRVASARPHFRQ